MEDSSILSKIVDNVNTVAILLLLLPLIHHRKSISPKTLLSIFYLIRTVVEDISLGFLCIIWVTLSVIPHCLCFTWRVLLQLYLKVRYGDLGHIIHGLDLIGVIDNGGSPVVITSLKVLQGPCDLDELRTRVQATVGKKNDSGRLVFPKFYQTLEEVTGYSCWKPAKFDINHHVRFLDDLQASSESTSETKTLEMISSIFRFKFCPDRSPWEILVVPKFHYDHEVVNEGEVESKFAIVIRIHHGIADGYSLLKLLIRDTALPGEPKVTCLVPGSDNSTSRPFPLWKTILVTLYLTFRSPRAIFVQLLSRDVNPLFGRIRSGETALVWSRPISLPFLKEVKQKNSVGLSTTFLTALMLSIRKYIVEEFNEVPQSLSAVFPFPAPNHPDNKMSNKFSVVRFPLPCAESDPLKSLSLVGNESRKLATAPDGPMNLFLQRLLGVYPNFFIRFFMTNRQSTLLVSNLPGTAEKFSIWGRDMEDSMFWIPASGDSGISASFLSYGSHFRLGLTVDTGIVRDGHAGAQRLVDGFLEAITAMANVAKVPLDQTILRPGPPSDCESEAETGGHDSMSSSGVDCGSDDEECQNDLGHGSPEQVPSDGRRKSIR